MNREIFAFLKELAANNNRVWFQENKGRYDVLRASFTDSLQLLINRIAAFDPDVAGVEAKSCLFRIYRDIRFSPDKTPYKRHFGAYIALGGRGSERGGYYLHLEPDNSHLAGGIWCPSPKLLKMLRQDIYDHVEEFAEIVENPKFKETFATFEGEVLKRMPVGYPADFPYAEILRHKDFCVSTPLPDEFFYAGDWIEKTAQLAELLLPLNRFLNYTADEYLGR